MSKSKGLREKNKGLLGQLRILNKTLGDGPVPIADFENLIDVRDSIIHADARTEWPYQGKGRKVADEYRNRPGGDSVELSENQVKDAVEKAIRQVVWYDKKIQPSP